MRTSASELPPLTWDEFLALPRELRNASLVDGEVVVNPPDAQHEMLVRNLVVTFTHWTRAQPGRGEVSTQQPVKINDRRDYQPDVAWYPPERCAPAGEPPTFTGRPDLVVEVLSPPTRAVDLIRKRGDYEHAGIGELWFVDADARSVLVCRRPTPDVPFEDDELDAAATLASTLLDGFTLPVAELFRR